MNYVNAETILPDKLIIEIQKYIGCGYLYIPPQPEKRKKWGETSGNRDYIRNRNEKIRNRYKHGQKINNIAEEFFLSIASIKKIIYTKNT